MRGFKVGCLYRSRVAVIVLLGVCAAACVSPPEMDLGTNPELYVPTGYVSKLSADRRVFVVPTVDAREPRAPVDASGPYTVNFYPDGRWHRAPAVMVDEVLRAELATSLVFASVELNARPEDCMMRVRLTGFDVGAESHVTGFRSFAAIRWALELHGPEGESGDRPLWLNRDFGGAQQSTISWVPPPAAVLMGMSLRQAAAEMLAALDQSNVGRSNIPLDISR